MNWYPHRKSEPQKILPSTGTHKDDLLDVDLNDNGVFESFEWSYVFDRDLDRDGVLDHQDPDYYQEYYRKRMPQYDYDSDGLFDDDPKDLRYGVDRVPPERPRKAKVYNAPDPDPDPDPARIPN
jgi:hypothetical protein